jgi:hypothetical protein
MSTGEKFMKKGIWLIMVFLLLPVLNETVQSNPRPTRGAILSMTELASCLDDSVKSECIRGASQLVGLSKEYQPLMVKALQNRFERVRLAGVEALSAVGDDESIQILCDYLGEMKGNRKLVIATAEALSRMRATVAIPILEKILTTTRDEVTQEYVGRSITRIKSPGSRYPVLEPFFGYVNTNFLIGDVKNVYFDDNDTTYRERRPYYFDAGEISKIFTFVRRSSICNGNSYFVGRRLTIELRDGRVATIYQNDDMYYYMNDAYYHQIFNQRLCFSSRELTEFIQEQTGLERTSN